MMDAYLHVPVYGNHRCFLQLICRGQTFRYTVYGSSFWPRLVVFMRPIISLKPLINLKPLQQYIRVHFSMTVTKNVFRLLQKGDWAVFRDIVDAYFHVPVYSNQCCFLQSIWRGQTFTIRYKTRPFDLDSLYSPASRNQ